VRAASTASHAAGGDDRSAARDMLIRHQLVSRHRRIVTLFKSVDKKAAARARHARKRLARSPVGQATAAHERCDALFQIALPVDESSAANLSEIEATGR